MTGFKRSDAGSQLASADSHTQLRPVTALSFMHFLGLLLQLAPFAASLGQPAAADELARSHDQAATPSAICGHGGVPSRHPEHTSLAALQLQRCPARAAPGWGHPTCTGGFLAGCPFCSLQSILCSFMALCCNSSNGSLVLGQACCHLTAPRFAVAVPWICWWPMCEAMHWTVMTGEL